MLDGVQGSLASSRYAPLTPSAPPKSRVPAERERPKACAGGSMAVSLDGVMVPMKNGGRQAKRAQAAEEGKYTRGPAGNKEVGCGTLSFYDEEGERLATIRMARMPEVKKATLFFTLNREDFSFVIHLDRQPRTSRRREAQTGSRARSGSRSERTLDAVEHEDIRI